MFHPFFVISKLKFGILWKISKIKLLLLLVEEGVLGRSLQVNYFKWAIMILTCRTESQGISIEKEILNNGGNARFIPQDVLISLIGRLLMEALNCIRYIDGVVNNAELFHGNL